MLAVVAGAAVVDEVAWPVAAFVVSLLLLLLPLLPHAAAVRAIAKTTAVAARLADLRFPHMIPPRFRTLSPHILQQ